MRELTQAEKLVFGATAKIDPQTDRPIEQGIGAVTERALAAQHEADRQSREAEQKTKAELVQALADLAAAETRNAELLARAEKAQADLAAAHTAAPQNPL